jgi:hypothetical protein
MLVFGPLAINGDTGFFYYSGHFLKVLYVASVRRFGLQITVLTW